MMIIASVYSTGPKTARSQSLPAAELLLKCGANIGDAFRVAMNRKNTLAVKLLLEARADPSRELGHAIMKDYLEGI